MSAPNPLSQKVFAAKARNRSARLGGDLARSQYFSAPMRAGGNNRIARRITRPGAARQRPNFHVVVRDKEKRDRHPVDAMADRFGRVDYAMQGGDPTIIGP